jgi:hypothetical protein
VWVTSTVPFKRAAGGRGRRGVRDRQRPRGGEGLGTSWGTVTTVERRGAVDTDPEPTRAIGEAGR